MAFPEFTHIHCSSRYDRTAASLEAAVDNWRQQSSIITLTEVSRDPRGATLAEAGWGYVRAKKDYGRDECAVCYRKDTWAVAWQGYKKLNTRGRVFAGPVCSCDALLKHRTSGHKLLITVTHMPSGVEGGGGRWNTAKSFWEARRQAYLSSLETWSTHIRQMKTSKKPDGIMIVADWNFNLKRTWSRDLLKDHFGAGYKQAWVRFPTSGSSLGGGGSAPLGAPGKNMGARIIDGTLYQGLKVETEPNLMPTTRSSDHRPYKERFAFAFKAGSPGATPGDGPASGDVNPGDQWWDFGDYNDDEIYSMEFAEEGS